MGIWFLFLDFYGYRENGLGLETTARNKRAKSLGSDGALKKLVNVK